MIASIRSRNISTMLMIQAESQLEEQFGYDAKTIIGNCDTYVYLGGNDIETARAVAERCDMPLNKILNMPVGTNWIFRRGQAPVNGVNFNLNMYLQEKSLQSRSQTCGEKRNVFSLRIKDLISAADYFLEREVRKMANTWNPCIEVESAHGTREILLTTRHLMNRKIFLEGEINSEMANAFLSQLLYLEEEPGKPVTIYINSPGGEVNAGLMIYDALMGSNLTVNMVCAGTAASMAAIIFAGGQKGRRYILPHSKVMIHEPLIAGGVGGSATSIHNISESILETRKICNGILAEHTGKTIEEIDEATSYDHYMNADEAIKFGICDLKITSLHLPSIGVK
jgi:ATP-dependent Clp protease protease subunit